jgi:hypothetical protein
LLNWINRKVKKMLAEAQAPGATPELQQRTAINVGAIALVLALVALPLLLIVIYLGLNFLFS